ncbi:O-antigen ligase family protein [Candidatus Endoriftia persephone]|nr:O-antigen ligase family protein [Candidatus Endoriftia persephone]EGV51612.1 hypothetical protein Rifp1Sym_bd00140 [endosymbiont of Riftia pachyptila (vent Ph05)]USF88023.1 O-antigen ligase family protein [Candidatus Endoriftia persephone]
MRVALIWMIVAFFSVYAWRDWFKTLCFLVVLMAFVERPDMPKAVAGIPGLNPWNLLFASTFLAWFSARAREWKAPKLPISIRFYLVWYLAIIVASYLRGAGDSAILNEYSLLVGRRDFFTGQSLFIDDIINVLKYVAPGIMFYYGTNDKTRMQWALASVLIMNLLLALQVIRWMPVSTLVDGDLLQKRAVRVIDREIGYFRSDVAVLLSGAAWAFFALIQLSKSSLNKTFLVLSSMACALAIALTGSRIGMGSWMGVAFILAWYRWRKFFFITPLVVMTIAVTIPSVTERFTEGFTQDTADNRNAELDSGGPVKADDMDLYTVTSGRTEIWPFVIEKIAEQPIWGHGRHAMIRSGIAPFLWNSYHESFPHPHNAYLELTLDNGLLFSIPIFIFFLIIVIKSLTLFRDKTDSFNMAIGGGSLAFTVSQLFGAVAGQSFYPMISQVSMWVMIFLMLRVSLERKNRNLSDANLNTEAPPSNSERHIPVGRKRRYNIHNPPW